MKRIAGLILSVVLVFSMVLPVTAQGNNTYLSEEIQQYCIEIGEEYGVCPELLMAMIETESSGNINAISKDGGCHGLMQINIQYHWDRLRKVVGYDDVTIATFYSPRTNIEVAADYLVELAEEYGDISYVLDVYNGNSKAEYNYENGILSSYAKKILERSEELERLHGK